MRFHGFLQFIGFFFLKNARVELQKVLVAFGLHCSCTLILSENGAKNRNVSRPDTSELTR